MTAVAQNLLPAARACQLFPVLHHQLAVVGMSASCFSSSELQVYVQISGDVDVGKLIWDVRQHPPPLTQILQILEHCAVKIASLSTE